MLQASLDSADSFDPGLAHAPHVISEQIQLLRAADDSDAAGVHTATQLRTAAAEGGEFVPYDIARKLLGDACTSGMAGLGWGKQAEELFDAIAVITDSGAGRDGAKPGIPEGKVVCTICDGDGWVDSITPLCKRGPY